MSEKKSSKKGKPAGTKTGGPMDVGLLQQIVSLMAANDLNMVEVRDGDRRIVLRRGAERVMVPMTGVTAAVPAPVAAAPAPAAAPAQPAAPKADAEDANLKPIKSPMVGTFYAAPSPDAKPFVSVGSSVDEDTDVCVIEAMKVFNNIKAEIRGTIAKILVQNGQSVEFGQTMFLVKPS